MKRDVSRFSRDASLEMVVTYFWAVLYNLSPVDKAKLGEYVFYWAAVNLELSLQHDLNISRLF